MAMTPPQGLIPNDVVDLTPSGGDVTVPTHCYAVEIGGAGDIKFITRGGTTATLTVPAGKRLDLQLATVVDTGTNATQIFGLTLVQANAT
jgi:hypothetical protein